MFGYQRVEQLFASNAHLSSTEIIQTLIGEGKKWLEGKPQDDDITLVAIKRKTSRD